MLFINQVLIGTLLYMEAYLRAIPCVKLKNDCKLSVYLRFASELDGSTSEVKKKAKTRPSSDCGINMKGECNFLDP